MNNRRNGLVRASGTAAAGNTAPPASPVHHAEHAGQEKLLPEVPAEFQKTNGHRETGLLRDSLHILERDGICHVISEDYSYKTEPYYTILDYELDGKNVRPSSSAVLDAYVVPMCLERAKLAGITGCGMGDLAGICPAAVDHLRPELFCHQRGFLPRQDDGERQKRSSRM